MIVARQQVFGLSKSWKMAKKGKNRKGGGGGGGGGLKKGTEGSPVVAVVVISEYTFYPAKVLIPQGAVVRWTSKEEDW